MATFERLNIAKRQPRPNSTNGWFGPYDANIIGGALIGIGMATTGACPGTVIVQVATGIKSGIYVTAGGLLGGILYARFGRYLKRTSRSSSLSSPSKPSITQIPVDTKRHYTIYAKYSLDPSKVLLAYEVMCMVIISVITLFGIDKNAPWLHPVFGGTLIGAAQASTLILTGSPIGVSAAYDEAGKYFWVLISPKMASEPRPKITSTVFAAGVFIGSLMMAQIFPVALKVSSVSPMRAIAGGCTMIIGARLAGGCTSGHGISGMSSFSISSIISVAAMFTGGIITATMLD